MLKTTTKVIFNMYLWKKYRNICWNDRWSIKTKQK